MRGLIWFLPDFRDWPVAVTRELQKRNPDWSFFGIVTGFAYDRDHIAAEAPEVHPLYFMDQLQREWLSRPFKPGQLAQYERIFGTEALNRILIADRNVGRGFVSGVEMPETPLMRMTAHAEGRNRYLVGLLDFLFDVFNTEKPDFVFAPGVAGALAMALALVCNHFGVNFRTLFSTRLGIGHAFTNSALSLSPTIEARFKQACAEPSTVAPWLDDARAFLKMFYERPHRSRDTDTSWQRAAHPLRTIDMAALAWRAIRRQPPALINLPYPRSYFEWEIKRRLRVRQLSQSQVFEDADALRDHRFVYLPLQVNPEASTMVLTPMLTDQIAIVEAIAKSLPMEMTLAVKEHLPMVGRRKMSFYRRLATIPKVKLIAPTADSFELIRRADLTCVITSTAGWEAILLKRPVLCLGRALYQVVGEGFVLCEELSRLTRAIAEALEVKPASDERIALFVASVFAESFDLPKKLRFSVTPETVAAHPEISMQMTECLLRSLEFERGQAQWRK